MLVSSEVTGLITLREMARDSIKVNCLSVSRQIGAEMPSQYSCLDPDEQTRALSLYDKRWLTFVDWVVDTFGEDSAAHAYRN